MEERIAGMLKIIGIHNYSGFKDGQLNKGTLKILNLES